MAKEKTFKTIIMDDLKAQGLAHIAQKITSITYKSYSGGCSVDVSSVNLFKADREKLESILKDYEQGSFDGMQDLYEYKKGPTTKERLVKYAFLRNEFTQEIKDGVKLILANQWDIIDDTTAQAKMGVWYDQATHRILQQLEGEL